MESKKRIPDGKVIVDIEQKQIELDIYVDPEFKGIKYELTSKHEIEPLDAAFCLVNLAMGICEQNNVNIFNLIEEYITVPDQKH